MEHLRSSFTDTEKEKFFTPDRGLFDVTIIRSKVINNLVVVICDTQDEPVCILRAKNIVNKTTEAYPYRMLFENIVKVEKLVLQDIDSIGESDNVIGRVDEITANSTYTVWADQDTYNVRNVEANLSSEQLAKLYLFGIKAAEQFGGLRIKSSRWVPRRKMLKDNASIKQDFIMKINVSNIHVKIYLETNRYFSLNIGSITREPVEIINPILTMLIVNNIELGFVAPEWAETTGHTSQLLSIPNITLKKTFSINNDSIFLKTVDGLISSPQPVQGFKLQDSEYQKFILNFYLLGVVQSPTVTIPYSIQPVM